MKDGKNAGEGLTVITCVSLGAMVTSGREGFIEEVTI